MKTLEVFSDYICPWCYLCIRRVDKLKETFGFEVIYRAFPLHPETPDDGLTLEQTSPAIPTGR